MKKLFTFLTVITLSLIVQADLKLDSPETLIERAGQNRQELLQVILDLNQQMPEIRNQNAFESYFFILDSLAEQSEKFNLNDIYPDAVKSLGQKMALFGIKWMDLTTFDSDKIPYYMKWFENEAYSSLLAVSTYVLKSTNNLNAEHYIKAGENLNLIIQNYFSNVKNRPDIVIGYQDTLSFISSYLIVNNLVTETEKDIWFNRIYTSNGLALFLDGIQKRIYQLNRSKTDEITHTFQNLKSAFSRSKVLVDMGGSWLNDRSSELSIEFIKKCFELNFVLSKDDLEALLSEFSPRYLQSLSMTALSTPENFFIDNVQLIENIVIVLNSKLISSQLMTESQNLDLFMGRTLAAIKIRSEKREGTYKLVNKKGQVSFLTIVSTKPLETAATLVDEKGFVYKNFFYFRYDSLTKSYLGSYGLYESDLGPNKSLLKIKFKEKNEIEVTDELALDSDQMNLAGSLIEPIQSVRFLPKLNQSVIKKFSGIVKFKKFNRLAQVEMIIQSNGQNIVARIRDEFGPIYDFSQGYLGEDGQLILNTNRLSQTSWSQFRGRMSDNKLIGQFIIGGRGIVTETFELIEIKEEK